MIAWIVVMGYVPPKYPFHTSSITMPLNQYLPLEISRDAGDIEAVLHRAEQ
jgi:hypothetical protein